MAGLNPSVSGRLQSVETVGRWNQPSQRQDCISSVCGRTEIVKLIGQLNQSEIHNHVFLEFLVSLVFFHVIRLAEVLVLGEQVVQNSQRRFQVQIHDILRSCLWLWQASIHHQLESETNIGHFLVKGLRS